MIFLYSLIIFILLLIPMFLKISRGSKILLNFFLGFIGITLLITLEFFLSPNYLHSPGDVLIYVLNWISYIIFNLISALITFIKPENRKEYYYFFPTIATFIVFILTSFDGLAFSFIMTGNNLLIFSPLYIYTYYYKYKIEKDMN